MVGETDTRKLNMYVDFKSYSFWFERHNVFLIHTERGRERDRERERETDRERQGQRQIQIQKESNFFLHFVRK